MRPERVWYLAYGSNVNETRFLRYLQGGPPEPGARDATPAAQSAWCEVPYRLTFGLESQRWQGGGVAFLDVAEAPAGNPTTMTTVRAWDITSEQFEDVCAQENRGEVGTALDWQALAAGPVNLAGSSWYRHVLPVAGLDLPVDQPALTFTSPIPVPANAAHDSYLNTIRQGLAEHPDLSSDDIDDYLRARTPA